MEFVKALALNGAYECSEAREVSRRVLACPSLIGIVMDCSFRVWTTSGSRSTGRLSVACRAKENAAAGCGGHSLVVRCGSDSPERGAGA